ncbi:DUF6069 family protein [Haladaptatus sp. DYF46]|uniref:DUF6069 family protein n=1 Tax=Haladaptatus sp. DYF46 TaxID=2886041 RepID=UPI001E433D28|nr:DUF6069 family protein [Haladaptatus sp. DYF46]
MAQLETADDVKSSTSPDLNRFVKYGLLTIVIAVIVNSAIRVVAYQFITIHSAFWPLGWEAVAGSTALTIIGATFIYWAVTRLSQRPNRIFVIIAALVLLLSFGSFIVPPPILEETPPSVSAVLAGMHVSVAVISVSLLTRISNTTSESDNRH